MSIQEYALKNFTLETTKTKPLEPRGQHLPNKQLNNKDKKEKDKDGSKKYH